jgi:ABC-type multidrug transport system fused ATPase/permease subunit
MDIEVSAIYLDKTYYVDMKVKALKPRRNPLLTATKILRSISRYDSRLFYEAWRVFQEYITYGCLEQNNSNCQYDIMSRAERFSLRIKEKLESTPNDDYIEAAALLYTILASKGLKIADGLGSTLLKSFENCIEFSYDIDSVFKSPALSRCLGFSNIMIDQLKDSHKKFIESKNEVCQTSSLEESVGFCTYAYFAKALRILISRDKNHADKLAIEIESFLKKYISFERYNWLPATVLGLLTYGLVSRISGKSNLDLKMKLLERLLKELEDINVRYVSKPFWITTELALVVSGLDRILYLSGDCIAITKAKLREIRSTMEFMKTSIAQRLTIWEGLLAIVGIALGVAGIALSIISIVGYMIPSSMILLLALASMILLLVLSIFVIVVNTITKSKSQDAERLIKELEEYIEDKGND